MNIGELVTKQDLEDLKKVLLQALERQNTSEQPKEWLRSKEVKKLMHISDGTLMNMRVKKLLNPSKVAGVYYYKLSEIQALLDAGTK